MSLDPPQEFENDIEQKEEQAIAEGDPVVPPKEPSALAERLRTLKSTTFRVADERQNLPHLLFWSLFKSEIKAIQSLKQRDRMLRKLVDGIGLDE